MSTDKIKEELRSINRSNTAFNYIIQDPTIEKLTKALSVAVENLSLYEDGCTINKKFIPNEASAAINTIAEILSGEGGAK